MDEITFRHFSNNLVKMVADWNRNFSKETKEISTKKENSIQGK